MLQESKLIEDLSGEIIPSFALLLDKHGIFNEEDRQKAYTIYKSFLEGNEELDYETPVSHNEDGYMSAPLPVDYSLIPWVALEEIGKVLTENCNEYGGKYDRGNWKKCKDYRQQLNGLLSHVNRLMKLQEPTQEEIEEHLTHIGCRAMMMIEIYFENRD